MSQVIKVQDEEQFESLTNQKGLVVVDFGATWCGPCRRMEPVFSKLATENPEVTFLKVDIDDLPDAAASMDVSALPTFKFLEDGEVIEALTMLGASEEKLRANLEALLLGNYTSNADGDDSQEGADGPGDDGEDGEDDGTF